ncbi:hypothetical protein PFISCL1PPCAC_10814, partial [Pristionchus fissidentatus]
LMSIPYGPGGAHPSAMAGYNTPPGYSGPPSDHYRGSMPSLVASSGSARNSYERDNREEERMERGVMRGERGRVIDGIMEVEEEEEGEETIEVRMRYLIE